VFFTNEAENTKVIFRL